MFGHGQRRVNRACRCGVQRGLPTEEAEAEARRAYATEQGIRGFRHNPSGAGAGFGVLPGSAVHHWRQPVVRRGDSRFHLGLGVAAVAGLIAGIPVGHLAERYGPRDIFLLTLVIQMLSMTSLLFAHSFWWFVVAMTVTDLAGSAGGAARGPLIRRFGGDEVPKFRSYLRSVATLASTFGALAAGVVVQFDTGTAYRVLLLVNALTFLASAAVLVKLPALKPLPFPRDAGRWVALKDAPYTDACESWGQGRHARRAIATASGAPGWAAVVIMMVGVALHTVGELWHAAGSLELRFRLAPPHAQGQYSGVFGMGMGLCYAIAPSLLGLLCITWGAPGWLLMGGIFVASGFAMPYVIQWAGRSRQLADNAD